MVCIRRENRFLEAVREQDPLAKFEVGIDGKISNILITQSVSEKLDQYTRQLISEMPVWLPSKHNGKNITSSVKIEITVPGLFEKAKVKVFQF